MERVAELVLDPQYHDILALLKGFRNGLVYGAKIRAPHAFVMTVLFKRGTITQKLRLVFNATKQHALNLAQYVTIYKTTMFFLRTANGGKERAFDSFLAGLLGGYIIFRENNNVNQQIVMYVFSRAVLAAIKVLASANKTGKGFGANMASNEVKERTWPIFASVCWGSIMWLWRWHPETVQPSLRNSMNYLYLQSDHWNSLRNFIWHNV
ncbi:hypothetical protein PYCC9005_000739 [Savitreella phatthalungensis]